jgi:four helix bundle protein
MKNGAIQELSFSFALQVIKVSRSLCEEKKEFILSKQLLRSGTAIGALVREAEEAESKADFIHKMSIALKESQETGYWLDLLSQSGLIEDAGFSALHESNVELSKLLTAIIRTSKGLL